MLNADQQFGHLRVSSQILASQSLSRSTDLAAICRDRLRAELRRIYAVPYVTSAASARILEKSGYRLEGRLRQSVIKNGRVLDQFVYSILRDEDSPGE